MGEAKALGDLHIVFKLSQATKFTNQKGEEVSVWSDFVDWNQRQCDLGDPTMQNYPKIFNNCHIVFSKLKVLHPDMITRVISLTLPQLKPVAGTCPFLPEGLQIIPHVTDDGQSFVGQDR